MKYLKIVVLFQLFIKISYSQGKFNTLTVNERLLDSLVRIHTNSCVSIISSDIAQIKRKEDRKLILQLNRIYQTSMSLEQLKRYLNNNSFQEQNRKSDSSNGVKVLEFAKGKGNLQATVLIALNRGNLIDSKKIIIATDTQFLCEKQDLTHTFNIDILYFKGLIGYFKFPIKVSSNLSELESTRL